jgi:hypothetical protein
MTSPPMAHRGGALRAMPGGLGAEAGGDVFLTAGTTLTLLVGGKPPEGGGGGSFVFGATTFAMTQSASQSFPNLRPGR